ncbi:MAG: aspartyl/glutamyl-tRNA amidotransferase subunit A, partial [Candidatus Obscuribacterales bacterium]|nr:aspartyl/glutamyl-tRNA amidotransferase subunit A [Candidatus Obscuribacterales bacterium]
MPELIGKSISQLRKLLDSKAVSAREITRASLDHIASHDQKTNAFLTITDKLALEQADDVDRIISESGKLPALAGIPVAIKDNICVEGYPTTCASKILGDFQPPYQATVIERLFAQGAICVGKANLDEFAMGSSNENTAFCVPRNPWDANKVPGGSSGGPAISVSAGYSVVGLGSDTGGSIRLPASFCGVVGMKPTYGVVSRYGLVAFASSLDQIGPFARSVEDVAITLSVIYGGDKRDSTSLHEPFRQGKFAAPSLDFALSLSDMDPQTVCKGLRVGVISDLTSVGVDADVGAAFSAAMQVIEGLGARIEEVTINHIKYALPVYYLLA